MKTEYLVLVAILAIIIGVIAIKALQQYTNQETVSECSQNSDCVAAECCHPTSCVFKDKAPECNDVMCTMECKPGTMDCGQGFCACIENKCQVVIE